MQTNRNPMPRKPKKVRVTRSENFLINTAPDKLGAEAEFVPGTILGGGFNTEHARALNWYNSIIEIDDARKYLNEYLIENNRKIEADKLGQVPDDWFPMSAAWHFRMTMRGATLTQELNDRLNGQIKSAFDRIPAAKEAKIKVTVQDHIKNKVSEVIGIFEEAIDFVGFSDKMSIQDALLFHGINRKHVQPVIEFYTPISDEAWEAVKTPGMEGWEGWTKAKLVSRARFYARVVEDARRYAEGTLNRPVEASEAVVEASEAPNPARARRAKKRKARSDKGKKRK